MNLVLKLALEQFVSSTVIKYARPHLFLFILQLVFLFY